MKLKKEKLKIDDIRNKTEQNQNMKKINLK